jgi:hypothetical protein
MMRKIEYAAVLLALSAGAAMAQGGDPPSRVGRLNYMNGPVSFRPASVEDWTAATLNYPLTTGDHLWTDQGGQTEIHVGSTAVRMGSQTAMSFLNLDDRIAQISLTAGVLNVHIRYLGENESVEVDTPNAAISLLRSGDYRVNADGENADTMINVRGGEAEVTAGGHAFPVRSGQSAHLAGMDNPSQDIAAATPPDGFDGWCQSRERREASAVSARYVPREMVGYEDLDENGVWVDVPPYGMVWRPRTVVAGWAPYHNGRWAWVEPWGWTWIDEAPWGFAPFHYGRWAFAGGGWFWVPGRMAVGVVAVRPVYAPALVAFVGGSNFNVAIGVGGGVGMAAWFPLGPGEVYRPAYHVSAVYVQNINIVHVSNVTVINQVNVTNVHYANQTVVGAVTVVPHEAFVGARPVAVAAVRVPVGAMARVEVVGSTAAIAPRRESVIVNTTVVVHAPPERFVAREVVVRNAPPPPPVSFAAKQQALAANGGRPLAPEEINRIRATAPVRAPMVRTVGQPAGAPGSGMARPTAEPRRDSPSVYRPPSNDRPPSARPAVTPNGAAPNNTPRPQTESARPAERVNEARPNEARPNEVRQPQTETAHPAATESTHPAGNDRPQERRGAPAKKAPPKKGENTEKKG